MAERTYWAEPPVRPERYVPSLERMIAEDDQVRLFDQVLDGVDPTFRWFCWRFRGDSRAVGGRLVSVA